jgi:hypothetical protein
MSGMRMLADWLRRARYVLGGPEDEPWPAWSTGERLAVAVLLRDLRPAQSAVVLDEECDTYESAVLRLSWEIEQDYDAATVTFVKARALLAARDPKEAEIVALALFGPALVERLADA